jgi:FdhD protein
LKLEFRADQIIQAHSTCNHIPAIDFRTAIPDAEPRTKFIVNLLLEESDLTFVVLSEPEIPVPDNTLPRYADQLRDFRHRIGSGRSLVMANEVMPFGNKQMANLKIGNEHALNDNSSPGDVQRSDLRRNTRAAKFQFGSMSLLSQNKSAGIHSFGVYRYFSKNPPARIFDQLAVEEPLEIVLCFRRKGLLVRKPISVTMRTPGTDDDLAIGFLFTEGIIHSADAITSIRPGPTSSVELTINSEVDLRRLERHFYTSSSCGVCGKTSLEALEINREIHLDSSRPGFSVDALLGIPQLVRERQSIFDSTGALHAAAFFDSNNRFVRICEDVGRHNAVDKLIGAELRSGRRDFSDLLMFVSGRAGFELVQKSIVSGIPFMAAVGAPSSLAVELARRYGSTLVGFLRENRFNLYSGLDRIRSSNEIAADVSDPVYQIGP